MTQLHLSTKLSLPIDVVVGTNAILGRKRMGKTYKAKVLAEEMLIAGQQIAVIDPTGAWWGLRSSADGSKPGFPITIFGGKHGDVPLEATAGAELAEALAADHFSAIFDLTEFTKGEEQRFCAAFLEALYRKNDKAMHLFLDEADMYAPQQPQGDEMRTLGACNTIVRRGGIKGIGITLITQRPAVLSKNVLTQCDTLITLCMSHPKDIDAIGDWVKVHAKKDVAKGMLESLPDLPKGHGWVWAPHRGIHKQIEFRDITTFDSSRTPKPGEKPRRPRVLSKVDLERLGNAIAATVERAKDNDPKLLRQKLVQLQKQLDAKTPPAKEPKPTKTQPAVSEKQLAYLQKLIDAAERMSGQFDARATSLQEKAQEIAAGLQAGASAFQNSATMLRHAVMDLTRPLDSPQTGRSIQARAPVAARPRDSVTGAGYERRVSGVAAGETAPIQVVDAQGEPVRLAKAELAILGAFMWLDQLGQRGPFDRKTIGVVAGYSVTSGHFENVLGRLRSLGLVEYPSGGMAAITESGRKIAPQGEPIPSLGDLHRIVRSKLSGAHQRILDVLINEYPDELPRANIAAAAGFSSTSGHFENLLGRLRTLGLVEYPRDKHARAAGLLFPEGFGY